jgi:hypothetical protein
MMNEMLSRGRGALTNAISGGNILNKSVQPKSLTICQIKKTIISRLFVYFLLLSVYLVSCTKSEPPVTINPGGPNEAKSNVGQSGNEQPYDGQ